MSISERNQNRGCPISPISCEASWVPPILMRLSLTKGAHADMYTAACRKFGVSRAFCEMWEGSILAAKPTGVKPFRPPESCGNTPFRHRDKRHLYNKFVISTEAYPDFLPRSATQSHVCASPQREAHE